MLEEIVRKLSLNIECELSIDELRILYSIDNNYMEYFNELINQRYDLWYEDFCRMFGKDKVALETEEINENTICYIGTLVVEEKLPTYNLRYIFGNFYYRLNYISNFENLEIVYGIVGICWWINSLDGLENLRIVNELKIPKYNLEFNLDYVYKLVINNCDYLDMFSPKLIRIDTIGIDGLKLKEGIERVVIDAKYVSNLTIPGSVKRVEMGHLVSYNNLILNEGIEELNLWRMRNIDNLKLPDSIEVLNLNNIKSLKNVTLPKNLKILSVGDITALRGITLYDDIIVKERLKTISKYELNKVAHLIPRENSKIYVK